ncbi:hypothetical protein RLIN73S_02277 [Rhodanobacter lindaniclasticus]|jgi:hypothetical protein
MACTTLSLFIVFSFVVAARFVVDKAEKSHRRRRVRAVRVEPPPKTR